MPTPSILPRVALFGLGNIGMRHLQGLGRIAPSISLEGVDPVRSSREQAEAEWGRFAGRGKFHADATAIDDASIVIIATSANGRLPLLREAIKLRPRSVVLEKVVFQRIEDFDVAITQADDIGIPVYVNCPRRVWPVYRLLKSIVLSEGLIDISVKGSAIGLACNSIHYVDLFQYLSGERELSLRYSSLEEIVASKRNGYFECNGIFGLSTPSGCRLDISVMSNDPTETVIDVTTGRRKFSIVESTGVVVEIGAIKPMFCEGRPPFQSELTGVMVEELLESGACNLPSLYESSLAHAPLLGMLSRHFEESGLDISGGVPIT